MSEAKFTEGKWDAVIDDLQCWVDSDEGLIADLENSDASYQEAEANAHLIAAAPEMYKFLDDLANGRGTDYPIEQLLEKARGEL